MALTQIIAPATISGRVGPVVKRWPDDGTSLFVQLDDALFTNPSRRVAIVMQFSWNGGSTWPYSHGPFEWPGGAKTRAGTAPGVRLGPFRGRNGVIQNPTHVRFYAEPVAGSGSLTIGLQGDVSEL